MRRAGGAWRGRSRDVGEAAEEEVQRGLAVVDSGTFLVGERDGGEHALEVVPGFEQLCLARVLRGVEVAFRAGHAVRALLEEGVGARPVAEVVVLPGLARGGGTGGDCRTVEEDLDRADVPGEVPGLGVGPGEGVRGDLS